jgi:FkbM family methyltransferase
VNFSGISNEMLLGKVLRACLRWIPPETRMPILQGKLKGKKWIAGSSNHGCWLGSYEYEKRRIFEKTVTEGSIVFDIGAHVGFYTLLASVLVGPRGKVFAFEPLPCNLRYLREHLRLNALSNVTVIEAAVSDCSGIASFGEGPNSSMAHISSQGGLRVKTVSLDDLISRGEIPVPNTIKIDVEGAEMLVLTGATSLLASAHPTLFLATHKDDLHQESCQLLRSLGYELQVIDEKSLEQSNEILAYHKS